MKEPIKKAVEIFQAFNYLSETYITRNDQKAFAVYLVDEIIKFGNENNIREPMMYWNSVKSEIKKL